MNADRQRVRLTIGAPAAAVADALKYHDADIESAGDATTDVTLWLDTWEWLLPQLARLDTDFAIIEPTSIRGALLTFARRLQAAADLDPTDDAPTDAEDHSSGTAGTAGTAPS